MYRYVLNLYFTKQMKENNYLYCIIEIVFEVCTFITTIYPVLMKNDNQASRYNKIRKK